MKKTKTTKQSKQSKPKATRKKKVSEVAQEQKIFSFNDILTNMFKKNAEEQLQKDNLDLTDKTEKTVHLEDKEPEVEFKQVISEETKKVEIKPIVVIEKHHNKQDFKTRCAELKRKLREGKLKK